MYILKKYKIYISKLLFFEHQSEYRIRHEIKVFDIGKKSNQIMSDPLKNHYTCVWD